ncbi:MAG: hypothetical protein JWM91_323 [Rhodospirillales bacterium]|nr:hypothetical protein [Rhodospirillales bacterium]
MQLAMWLGRPSQRVVEEGPPARRALVCSNLHQCKQSVRSVRTKSSERSVGAASKAIALAQIVLSCCIHIGDRTLTIDIGDTDRQGVKRRPSSPQGFL